MKKVYTITFHNANNYGAVIQAYALQKVLEKKYETSIIDYENKDISKVYKLFKFTVGNYKIKQFIKDLVNLKKDAKRNNNFNSFRKKLNLTKPITSVEEINNLNADAIIVGSDQVWNPNMTNGVDDIYTLNFEFKNSKKISYAASSGNREVLENNIVEYSKRIEKFNSISVRETGMKEVLESRISNNISLVLDPSLLLTKEEWSNLAGDIPLIKEKYLFVYCGDESDFFYDIVNDIAQKENLLIVHFGRRDRNNNFKFKKKSLYEVGPIEFINLIKYSSHVVTASFHGTALGIILNKSIFIVLNKYQDRLKTLANSVSINDRVITNYNDYKKIKEDITDWNKVNSLLELEREKSIKWLYNAIEDGE